MARFNLDDYEPVEERIVKFYDKYPDGRITTEVIEYTAERILVMAHVFRNFEDDKPLSTGLAEETRGEGGPVNDTSHVENCETSAIGRALANCNFAPKGKRPSREEMKKVERAESTKTNSDVKTSNAEEATEKQKVYVATMLAKMGRPTNTETDWSKLTKPMASAYISGRIDTEVIEKVLGIE